MMKKIRVLWSVNVIINEVAQLMGIANESAGSWMDQLSHKLRTEVELFVVYPTWHVRETTIIEGESIVFIAIPLRNHNGYDYEIGLTKEYASVLDNVKPDVIHQWGTEFPNAWNLVQACQEKGRLEKVVVSIQGLIGVWGREENFYAALPSRIIKKHSFKDLIRRNSLAEYREKYMKRSEYEVKVLKNIKHVIGRTGFDRRETSAINPKLKYHHNNETLREVFYEGAWSEKKCIPHRVFISQAGMPYKGFHLALEGLGKLKKEYPDITIVVTGRNLGSNISLKEKLKLSAYEQYIRKLLRKYELADCTTFLGKLNAEEMKAQYLRANLFLLPSSIENSPNSLGEAMLLGVPTVAADVGGVGDLMTNEEEGLIYSWPDVGQMAEKVCRIFREDSSETRKRTEKARCHALATHDPEENVKELLEIYRELSNGE